MLTCSTLATLRLSSDFWIHISEEFVKKREDVYSVVNLDDFDWPLTCNIPSATKPLGGANTLHRLMWAPLMPKAEAMFWGCKLKGRSSWPPKLGRCWWLWTWFTWNIQCGESSQVWENCLHCTSGQHFSMSFPTVESNWRDIWNFHQTNPESSCRANTQYGFNHLSGVRRRAFGFWSWFPCAVLSTRVVSVRFGMPFKLERQAHLWCMRSKLNLDLWFLENSLNWFNNLLLFLVISLLTMIVELHERTYMTHGATTNKEKSDHSWSSRIWLCSTGVTHINLRNERNEARLRSSKRQETVGGRFPFFAGQWVGILFRLALGPANQYREYLRTTTVLFRGFNTVFPYETGICTETSCIGRTACL